MDSTRGVPSSFNLDAFVQGSFEGKGDTRRVRVEPKEYNAQIVGPFGEKTKLRQQTNDKGAFLILDVVWQPDDPEQAQRLGIEKLPTVRQSIFLDLTANGGLDLGPLKNGDLNRLREAIGLNQDGQKWKWQDFIGRPAKIKVTHKPNPDEPENPYQNVVSVAPL